jgi:hypothetical protein
MLENMVRSIETPKNQQEEIKLNLNKVNEEYNYYEPKTYLAYDEQTEINDEIEIKRVCGR